MTGKVRVLVLRRFVGRALCLGERSSHPDHRQAPTNCASTTLGFRDGRGRGQLLGGAARQPANHRRVVGRPGVVRGDMQPGMRERLIIIRCHLDSDSHRDVVAIVRWG